ncbi:cysteine-rich venom protein latisemin-like [Ostrea edulis]|uniref:cysteine-rich venom protein latisemin-like n=1 Tax=Ostrea edulis TaxID=37623 RepID=UPI0024AFA7E0|nr:cysteine-rich venom protein latisemin-like [Ostrea edulis]XP_056004987.1 cysteine-rich venom protein latisemin-like [Ostrea edulis]
MEPSTCLALLAWTGVLSVIASGHRLKRSTSCAKKYEVIPNHSACLPKSSTASASGVSDADKRAIVDKHNEFRSGVQPTAVAMAKMSWDDEIAMVAQKYADACKGLVHDGGRQRGIPGRFSVGQNLASASYDLGWPKVVKLWYDEVKDFTLGGTNQLSLVGHYTQVVWAKSIKIGCGYAICGSTRSYVCNYGPGGNLDINNPYTSGTSCSQCQSNCANNLCDCQGKACENGGTMDFNTCTCTCKTPSTTYFGPSCRLNCTGQKDASYLCGPQYTPVMCGTYTNVPVDCPAMCDVCPYAGVGYDSSSSPGGGQSRLESQTQLSFLSTILFIVLQFTL